MTLGLRSEFRLVFGLALIASDRCNFSSRYSFYPGVIDILFLPGQNYPTASKQLKDSGMKKWTDTLCTAFEGNQCITTGELKVVAMAAKSAVDRSADQRTPRPVLIFDDATSEIIELDWRGSVSEFQARFDLLAQEHARMAGAECPDVPDAPTASGATDTATSPEAARGPGRPRLGVVAREVTLLPRHWEWLASQPGGASVALRKLVEVARRSSEIKDRVRQASAVGYKFMSTMAGHEPGFEEASRALFAADQARFEALIAAWPVDVQTHLKKILADAF